MSYLENHPTDATLKGFVMGTLDCRETALIEIHVINCESCTDTLIAFRLGKQLLDMDGFNQKILNAGDFLRSLCPTGEPTEEQVKEVTGRFGLPVTFNDKSFVLDPVRMAVFITAYIPKQAVGALHNAWQWQKTL